MISKWAVSFALLVVLDIPRSSCAQSRIETAFQKFWAARTPREAASLVGEIVRAGVTFEEALKRLKAGRAYTEQPTGVVKLTHKLDGVEYFYALNVPSTYNPAKKYRVRFQLHGGVGGRETNQPRGTGEIGTLAGAEQIYVIPYAWIDAPWWSERQVSNLETIIDLTKRAYNVDENRVVVAGVSDGGTGAYYIAMRETTPYASFLPLNAFIMVLSNGDIDDGKIFPNNLRNKPLFVINGGRDRLYPIRNVEPFTKHLMASGVNIDYHPKPDGEHNTAWWPEIKGPFEKFVADHPRDPYPDKLTWEAAGLEHNRSHWLVIDRLAPTPTEGMLPDPNVMADNNGTFLLFGRPKPAGRVDLARSGNTIQATTRGVTAFTLLLSPDEFDFGQPIKVVANGHPVFEGRAKPSLDTLLKWAARDNDRTMLYAAELKINLER